MLVGAGYKKDFVALKFVPSREGVCCDFLICVADVGFGVYVVDCCCYVKFVCHIFVRIFGYKRFCLDEFCIVFFELYFCH